MQSRIPAGTWRCFVAATLCVVALSGELPRAQDTTPAKPSATAQPAAGTGSQADKEAKPQSSPKDDSESKPDAEVTARRLRVDAANAMGRILYRPAPDYPAGAPALRAATKVKLEVVVGTDGRVLEAKVTEGGDAALAARAAATAQQWRYSPYLVDGYAVEFETAAEMDFKPGISTPRALATAAYQAGYNAFLKGDYEDALKAFRHVLQYDPKFGEGWNEIGRTHLIRGEYKEAVAAFERELKESPGDVYARNNIGLAHWLQKQYPEALASYGEQLRRSPKDETALTSVGLIHEEQQSYAAAAPELERVLAVWPSNTIRIALANCYCHLNQADKCASLVEAAASQPDSAANWQAVAAAMAERGLLLDDARKYAQRAISTFEMLVAETNAAGVGRKDLQNAASAAAAWGTLGLVYMKRGDLDDAERYLKTAWLLSPDDLYPQLLEKKGNKEEATRYYRMSVAQNGDLHSKERLLALAGAAETSESKLAEARSEFAKLNSIHAGVAPKDLVQGEFYLISRAEVPNEVHFIAGDESLREFGPSLRQVKDPVQFESSPVRTMLRRVEVTCMKAGQACSVRFLLPKESLERVAE